MISTLKNKLKSLWDFNNTTLKRKRSRNEEEDGRDDQVASKQRRYQFSMPQKEQRSVSIDATEPQVNGFTDSGDTTITKPKLPEPCSLKFLTCPASQMYKGFISTQKGEDEVKDWRGLLEESRLGEERASVQDDLLKSPSEISIIRKRLAINECFRLDDKRKYLKLLQQHSDIPIYPPSHVILDSRRTSEKSDSELDDFVKQYDVRSVHSSTSALRKTSATPEEVDLSGEEGEKESVHLSASNDSVLFKKPAPPALKHKRSSMGHSRESSRTSISIGKSVKSLDSFNERKMSTSKSGQSMALTSKSGQSMASTSKSGQSIALHSASESSGRVYSENTLVERLRRSGDDLKQETSSVLIFDADVGYPEDSVHASESSGRVYSENTLVEHLRRSVDDLKQETSSVPIFDADVGYPEDSVHARNLDLFTESTDSISRRKISVDRSKKVQPESTDSISRRKINVDRSKEVQIPDRLQGMEEEIKRSANKWILDTHILYNEDFLQDLLKKFDVRDAERRTLVCEEIARKNLLSSRNAELLQKALEERLRKYLVITEAAIDESYGEDAVTPLPELTNEMLEKIRSAIQRRNPDEVVARGFNLSIRQRDIRTLGGLNWLNDEVINFYMNLIMARGGSDGNPSAYCFNTFFYPKVRDSGQAACRRWTRKEFSYSGGTASCAPLNVHEALDAPVLFYRIDLFSYDMIVIPVHMGVHWCMCVVDFRKKSISYFDSMGAENRVCLQAVFRYLQDEHWDKKQQKFVTEGWTLQCMKDIPQQMNGSDCGVFSCMFAEYLTRDAKITFTQENMPYFRQKMMWEILSCKLML